MMRCVTSRKGFSLIELAIVLGLAGVALAGVTMLGSSMRNSARISQTSQQLQVLVRQVRTYYGGRALPAAAIDAATYTATMRTAKVFPAIMCNAACIGASSSPLHLYGGTVTLAVPYTGQPPLNQMEIVLNGTISKEACIRLGVQVTARSTETGLTLYRANSASYTSFPVGPATLVASCVDANTIILRYKIRV